MKLEYLIVLSLCMVSVSCHQLPSNKKISHKTLRFCGEGSFKIVQFTDTHWKNGDPNDLQTTALMGSILDLEKPDLVVLTGDVLAGKDCEDSLESLARCATPMIEREIPWAMTFGNHDDEGSASRAELMIFQRSLPYCFSQCGPKNITGVSNYYLPIYAARENRTRAILYFIDSNGSAPEGMEGYAWIAPDQIEWYLDTAEYLRVKNGGSSCPALCFFHIPLMEYNDIWNANVCIGNKYEEVCCPALNSGFFTALLQGGDVIGTFVGHDHVNDYEGTLHGIGLCYGRASGINSYGREDFPRGARVILLREGIRNFQTWLRLENGEVLYLSRPVRNGL